MNNYFKHPSSIVDTDKVGENSRIWAFVHILKGAVIGANANICDHCFIENEVTIGDDVTVKCGVWIWDGVVIGNKVMIGPSVVFTNDVYPRSKNTSYIKKQTILNEGCSIGANSTLIAGVTIGAFAMVGAGSVVTRNVGDFEIVYGNPARLKGYICKCGEKITFDNTFGKCNCGLEYSHELNKVNIGVKK